MPKANLLENMHVDGQDFVNFLADLIDNPIFIKDRKHRWVFLNEAFCSFFGGKRDDLIGKSDYDFFSKAEADVFWKKDEEVFTSGLENVNEENFTDSKGVTHVIITKKVSYENNQGEKFLVGTISDITARKKAEEKFSKIFKVTPTGVIISRIRDGVVVEVNEEALRIIGHEEENVLNKSIIALNVWFDPADRGVWIKELLKSNLIRGKEIKLRRKNGEIIQVSLSGVLIDLDGEKCVISSIVDISEQKKSEEKIRQHALDLEKMNKLMVDRELKMIELKKKLSTLNK